MKGSIRAEVLQSILRGLSIAQALAWDRAIATLLERLLPIEVYGPAASLIIAALTTAVCLGGAWAASNAVAAVDAIPTAPLVEFVVSNNRAPDPMPATGGEPEPSVHRNHHRGASSAVTRGRRGAAP